MDRLQLFHSYTTNTSSVPTQQTNQSEMKSTNSQNISSDALNSNDAGPVLSKQQLQQIVKETDRNLNLDEEVEELLLEYVDEYVDRCLNGAALIAKNRQAPTIEVKDVQQFLNRTNTWTPGFGTDALRPYKRSMTTDAHKQRLGLMRKKLKKY